MPGVFDATFVKHRLNEVFKLNHGVADSIHQRFEHHGERDTEWRQHGPIFVHHTEEGPTLVKFDFEADLSGDREVQEQFIAQKLDEVQAVLASMVRPGEEYHLVMEERPHVSDGGTSNRVTYAMKGIIVQSEPTQSVEPEMRIEP